ncbi:MAG TPA: hypothetical protein VFF11_16800, partial [Candidatus Binatia bacterium]|nr:hypothetical protein [Candidatus Binatia bacterium]
GRFQRVIPDASGSHATKRVLLCSGKVYYELDAHRKAHQRSDVAIIRLEQFYPLHARHLEEALRPYADNTPTLWIQEEPANMGAWTYLHERFGKRLLGRFPFALVSRFESASPATGSAGAHKLEQARIIARAFGDHEPNATEFLAAKAAAAPAGTAAPGNHDSSARK